MTSIGRDQQNGQAAMFFTKNDRGILINRLSENIWKEKYLGSDIYRKNAHINHVYILTKNKSKKKINQKKTGKVRRRHH